jgi:excisionase family DNA binding protein
MPMKYITSKDTAEILGINISTLKRWTDNGTIDCTRTAGGHRKFTIQHVRDYYKDNKKAEKSTEFGLETSQHKKIYNHINQNQFSKLAQILADSSLESDDLTVNTIVNGSYMKGVSMETLFDEIVDPGSMIVENALRQNYISHLEAFISRKLITRTVERLNSYKNNGSFNGKSALCVNFEENLPDLGVVMSEVILRHNGFNVFNTGSHAKLGDLSNILEKKLINVIVFYLCDMQCCMATVKDNISKTEYQVEEILKISESKNVKVLFGGTGLEFLPSVKESFSNTFITFAELKSLIL